MTARLTFVYDQPWRAPISAYERPCAFSISAVASSGFSARNASAERRTRSSDASFSSTLRSTVGTKASRSMSSPVTDSERLRRIAIASWRTTTFSHATSVSGSTVATRRTKISRARW